jgi:hypothetical protein
MKSVKCKSGVRGWQAKLHEVYDSLEEFRSYCETRGIHTRLGFKSIVRCWKANPTVQGSVIPSDLHRVKVHNSNSMKCPIITQNKYNGYRGIFNPNNIHTH